MIELFHQLNFKKALLIGSLIIVIYSFILTPLGWFDVAKLKAKDFFYNITLPMQPVPPESKEIVLISIDDRSFKVLNKKWPWGRNTIAQMLDILKGYEPLAVCLDFVFVGESENSEHDLLLSAALKNAGNVLLPAYFGERGEYVHAQQSFSESAFATGVINLPKDKDTLIRNTRPIVFSVKGRVMEYSLGVKAACKYFGIPLGNTSYQPGKIIFKQPAGAKLSAADIQIPVRKDGTMALSYKISPRHFKVVPFWKVYRKMVPRETFENKIVLVGLTSELFHDIHNTPVGILPGTVVIAYDILMLISRDFVKETSWPLDFIVLVLFALAAVATTYFYSTYKGFFCVLLEIALFTAAGITMSLHNLWWDFFSVVFVVTLIYVAISFYKYVCLLIESAKLKTLAITDELTGLFTFRYFQLRLQNEFERVTRYGNALSLVILDIDHFKKLNDTYGHQKGNIVLKALAKLIYNSTRKADVIFRYGGEEFCIILPQNSQAGAIKYAERLRETIESSEFLLDAKKSLKVTVSIGVAEATSDVKLPNDLIERADQALYKAKTTGRNMVCGFA